MNPRSSRSSVSLLRTKEELSPIREDWSDSDSLDLPLYSEPRASGIRAFFTRWYSTLLFGLLTVAFVATWAATIVLAWRLASEQACTASYTTAAVGGSTPDATQGGSRVTLPHGTHPQSHSHHEGHEGHESHENHEGHENHEAHVGAGSLHVPGYRLAYNSSYCNGVRDPEGARARGCIFDPIQTGWMPGACVDTELTEEFITSEQWQWFEDEERTKPTTQEVVLRGYGLRDSYTIDDYHFRHCQFVMKQLIRNFLTSRAVIGFKGLHEEHLEHCLDRLINWNTPEIRNAWTEHVRWTGSGECYEKITS
ncbi:hypothetical protein KVR01_000062 [Diaporthe batatas]|uniref:uncharacterized protein n=1 Tax=Diaporthe batatas TaxID=748121 RepID=UPI001D05812F|nr:uncharacterized protein KVR01_000062 [Diaporthe batatas]KAG8169317.1 hypothetical protein KVR01_000062 [Diaporthe batatas]